MQSLADLFPPANYSRVERLQRVPEIFCPLLLKSRKLRLDKPGDLVKHSLRIQCCPLGLQEMDRLCIHEHTRDEQ